MKGIEYNNRLVNLLTYVVSKETQEQRKQRYEKLEEMTLTLSRQMKLQENQIEDSPGSIFFRLGEQVLMYGKPLRIDSVHGNEMHLEVMTRLYLLHDRDDSDSKQLLRFAESYVQKLEQMLEGIAQDRGNHQTSKP